MWKYLERCPEGFPKSEELKKRLLNWETRRYLTPITTISRTARFPNLVSHKIPKLPLAAEEHVMPLGPSRIRMPRTLSRDTSSTLWNRLGCCSDVWEYVEQLRILLPNILSSRAATVFISNYVISISAATPSTLGEKPNSSLCQLSLRSSWVNICN